MQPELSGPPLFLSKREMCESAGHHTQHLSAGSFQEESETVLFHMVIPGITH